MHNDNGYSFNNNEDNMSHAVSRTSIATRTRKRKLFTTAHATQKFSENEKKQMAKFSSVTYSPTYSWLYKDWLVDHPLPNVELDRWFLVICIGLASGVVAWLLSQSLQAVSTLKWEYTLSLAQNNSLFVSFLWTSGLSCIFIIISCFMVTVVHPPGAGSGVPEVIAYLNGVTVHGTQSLKNLVVKFISLIFAVCSGLPVATYGPVIAMGAIIGVGVGQFKSKACDFFPKAFSRFRNSEDRRSFTTAGVAAGAAAAFNAPIGGLLFVMEDMSTFWTRKLCWQTFFCSGIAAATASMLASSFHGFEFKGLFGHFNQRVIEPVPYNVSIFVASVVLGIGGGFLGAIFTRLNNAVNSLRKRILAKIASVHWKRIFRFIEAIVFVNIMAGVAVYLPTAMPCTPIPHRNLSNPFIICGIVENVHLNEYTCHTHSTNHTKYFSEMATLVQSPSTTLLKTLQARSHHRHFSYETLLYLFPIYFLMTCLCAGLAVVGGTFVPLLISGSLYGRALGLGLLDLYNLWTGHTITGDKYWQWLDPGLFAVLGAGSLLGGVTRLTLAITFIIVELSQDLDLVVPLMVANFIAKVTADMLSKPLYSYQFDLKALPYLDPELDITLRGHPINPEQFHAEDIMQDHVKTILSRESIGYLARLLLDTEHGAFPVVKYDSESRTELCYGLISRNELYVILCCEDVYTADQRPDTVVRPQVPYEELSVDYITDLSAATERMRTYAKFEQYNRMYVELDQYINTSAPKIDKGYSLARTYTLFRTLGCRHLTVIDINNRVVGMITRKDLMRFNVIEKVRSIDDALTMETQGGDIQLPQVGAAPSDDQLNMNMRRLAGSTEM